MARHQALSIVQVSATLKLADNIVKANRPQERCSQQVVPPLTGLMPSITMCIRVLSFLLGQLQSVIRVSRYHKTKDAHQLCVAKIRPIIDADSFILGQVLRSSQCEAACAEVALPVCIGVKGVVGKIQLRNHHGNIRAASWDLHSTKEQLTCILCVSVPLMLVPGRWLQLHKVASRGLSMTYEKLLQTQATADMIMQHCGCTAVRVLKNGKNHDAQFICPYRIQDAANAFYLACTSSAAVTDLISECSAVNQGQRPQGVLQLVCKLPLLQTARGTGQYCHVEVLSLPVLQLSICSQPLELRLLIWCIVQQAGHVSLLQIDTCRDSCSRSP